MTDEGLLDAEVVGMSVAEAAAHGTTRDLLVAMRDHIAAAITAGCPPRDLASLTRRLREIAKDIEALDAQEADEVIPGGEFEDEAFRPEAI